LTNMHDTTLQAGQVLIIGAIISRTSASSEKNSDAVDLLDVWVIFSISATLLASFIFCVIAGTRVIKVIKDRQRAEGVVRVEGTRRYDSLMPLLELAKHNVNMNVSGVMTEMSQNNFDRIRQALQFMEPILGGDNRPANGIKEQLAQHLFGGNFLWLTQHCVWHDLREQSMEEKPDIAGGLSASLSYNSANGEREEKIPTLLESTNEACSKANIFADQGDLGEKPGTSHLLPEGQDLSTMGDQLADHVRKANESKNTMLALEAENERLKTWMTEVTVKMNELRSTQMQLRAAAEEGASEVLPQGASEVFCF